MLNKVSEGFVELACLLGQRIGGIEQKDFDVGVAEVSDAAATDEGIGVYGGYNAAGDTSGDERVGAGTGTAVMNAGLKRNVGGCAAEIVVERCCLLERGDLCVVARVVEVGTFAKDGGIVRENTTNGGIWRGKTDGVVSKLECSLHEAFVLSSSRRVLRHVIEHSCSCESRFRERLCCAPSREDFIRPFFE